MSLLIGGVGMDLSRSYLSIDIRVTEYLTLTVTSATELVHLTVALIWSFIILTFKNLIVKKKTNFVTQ